QGVEQAAVFVRAQRGEAADGAVGRGAHAEVGAVHVRVLVAVVLAGEEGGAHARGEVTPVGDAHGAAEGVGIAGQLRGEPVGGHAAVGVGGGQPARAFVQQQFGRGGAGAAYAAGVQCEGAHAECGTG